MAQQNETGTSDGSIIDPSYSKGDYFSDAKRHSEDAGFKAACFLKLFLPFLESHPSPIRSLADVGCGSGDIVRLIAASMRENGYNSITFKGYDVSPHASMIENEGVEYINADFCESGEPVDVVTLFDVFEHIPDTVGFLKGVSQRCKVIGFHIPLEHSLNVASRNLFRRKLVNPGHLVFLDIVSALNLLAVAGLRVVDYQYTFGFLAPSGHATLLSKIVFPFRYILAKISPWLLSVTIGGASVAVIALTPTGLHEWEG